MRNALLLTCVLVVMPADAKPTKFHIRSNPILVTCSVDVPWLSRRAESVDAMLCGTAVTTLRLDPDLAFWKFVVKPGKATARIDLTFRYVKDKVTATLAYFGLPKGKNPVPQDLLTPHDFVDGLPETKKAIGKLQAGIAARIFNDEVLNDLYVRLTKRPFGTAAAWYDTDAAELVVPLQYVGAMDAAACRIRVEAAVPSGGAKRTILSRTHRPVKKTSDFQDQGQLVRGSAVIAIAECAESDTSMLAAGQIEGLTSWDLVDVYLYERLEPKTLQPPCELTP